MSPFKLSHLRTLLEELEKEEPKVYDQTKVVNNCVCLVKILLGNSGSQSKTNIDSITT